MCVLVLVAVSWGYLTGILEPQGAIPRDSNSPQMDYVYRLVPETPLFRRMPTRPGAFWGILGMSGLQSCARTHFKIGLVAMASTCSAIHQKTNCSNSKGKFSHHQFQTEMTSNPTFFYQISISPYEFNSGWWENINTLFLCNFF